MEDLATLGSVRSVELVDHEIDDNAGDGDVEPEGEGPAGDEAVLVETLQPSAAQSDDDHGHDDNGENGVGQEQSEVDGANPTLTLEMDHLMGASVVDEIGNQEGAGNEESGDHEFLVERDFAGTNRGIAGDEEYSADAVEGGVEGGVGHGSFRFWVRPNEISDQISAIRNRPFRVKTIKVAGGRNTTKLAGELVVHH